MELEDRDVENQVKRLTKETVVSGKRVEVGKLASRSILATVLEERSVHEEKEHRHGRTAKESDHPVTLQNRINGDKWHDDHRYGHAPLGSTAEGNDIAIAVRLFQSRIAELRYIRRMPARSKASYDPIHIHKNWWRKFAIDKNGVSWLQMPLSQKQQHLKEFLFKKFTLDPTKNA